uniref:Uncharacterized protein n=1 Tax=Rhizophagus irregularis (strain DAOM 181602 / DAOM 197198 / MUCL 43194) TaxID=747089 RepID=U9T117_RHIID
MNNIQYINKQIKHLKYTKALTEPEVNDYKYLVPYFASRSNHIDITPIHVDIILAVEITANSSIDPPVVGYCQKNSG